VSTSDVTQLELSPLRNVEEALAGALESLTLVANG
jgi:hypothetical protein